VVLFAIGAGVVASLNQSVVSCARSKQSAEPRPLSTAEAQRLAAMRLTNYRDARSGLHATIGQPGQEIRLTGWVDWQRRIAYLAATGPAQAKVDGLVQAMPGIIAIRRGQPGSPAQAATPSSLPGSPTQAVPAASAGTRSPVAAASATSGPAAIMAGPLADPPAMSPSDGWRVRLLNAPGSAATTPLDTFVTLLFGVAANHPDAADLLAGSQAQWLARDKVDGVPVDVLLGPFVPPSARPSPSPSGPPIGPIAPTTTGSSSTTAKAGKAAGTSAATRTNTTADTVAADAAAKTSATASTTTKAGATASPGAITSPAASRPPDNSLAAMGGAVRYYLDGQSRVRRLDALLGANLPVQIDFQRDERPELTAIDELGGAAVTPRAITPVEAKTLSRLRLRDLATRGGTVTVTMPTAGARVVRATGWLDWANTVAYLALSDPDEPGRAALLVADRAGVATRSTSPPSGKNRAAARLAKPPLPPPSGKGWTFSPWAQRADEYGSYDLDLLLSEALSLSSRRSDDAGYLLKTAVWLRTDAVDGVPATVYEIPKPAEKGAARGQARLRYWVDKSGVLRRLEVRTRITAFAQLDLTPGPVPKLGPAG
jgi:hypothetical protein